MARKPKPAAPAFPELNCAACRFCLGERDAWECWSQPPRLLEAGEVGIDRGRPTDPLHPACFFFQPRSQ